jgi:hypothetical protein
MYPILPNGKTIDQESESEIEVFNINQSSSTCVNFGVGLS